MIIINLNNTCIALIPAYEPEPLLIKLLEDLDKAGFMSIVVDDGSGDLFADIFAKAGHLSLVLTHKTNEGKGSALRTGLTYIRDNFEDNYVVVTLDADGQHRVLDAVRICETAQNTPGTLVLGSRQLSENVPIRSRFGNSVTRCAYSLSTGLHIHDTQTGLRAFSSSLVPFMLGITGMRYEYEMNVLLECPHRKIPIIEVEIPTIYIDNNSASHFDPIKDSYRVYKEITKFSISSFIGFLVDYGMFSLFFFITSGFGIAASLQISNIAARIISASVNYTINRKLVFKCNQSILESAGRYFALAILILAGNTLLLSFLVEVIGFNQGVGKVITELAFFLLSWLVQKFFIFSKERVQTE